MLPTSAREPVDVDAARFIGATIQLFDAEVLVVQVAPRVITDRGEAPALVAAFQARFNRTIVLVAQDRRGVPTFFGPGPIAKVLANIPFEALAWKRYRYRPPRPMMLPIPIDPPRDPSDSFEYAYDSDESAYRSVDQGADRRGDVPTRDLGAKPHADRSGGRLPGTTRSLGVDGRSSQNEVDVRARNLGGTTLTDARSHSSLDTRSHSSPDRADVRARNPGGTTHPDTSSHSSPDRVAVRTRSLGTTHRDRNSEHAGIRNVHDATRPWGRRTQTLVAGP